MRSCSSDFCFASVTPGVTTGFDEEDFELDFELEDVFELLELDDETLSEEDELTSPLVEPSTVELGEEVEVEGMTTSLSELVEEELSTGFEELVDEELCVLSSTIPTLLLLMCHG